METICDKEEEGEHLREKEKCRGKPGMGCVPLYGSGEPRTPRSRGSVSWSQVSPLVTWTCLPQPWTHPIHPQKSPEPFSCAAFPGEQLPHLGRVQRDFDGVSCTEFAPARFDGLLISSSIFITMIALHSQKIGLPGFTTFNRYSVWLCVVLTKQITRILQAGGSH